MVHIQLKRLLQAALVLLAALFLFLYLNYTGKASRDFAAEVEKQSAGVVPVVFLCPQTGYYSFIGEDAAWAAEYAVRQLNRNGGIHGKKVRLILKDTESDSTLAARLYEGAAEVVPLVIGPVDAPGSTKVGRYLKKDGSVSIATYSYSTVRKSYRPYTISYMSDSEPGEYQAVRRWLQDNPDIKKVVIFSSSEDRSKSNTLTRFREVLPKMGIRIVHVVDVPGNAGNGRVLRAALEALNVRADGYISLLSSDEYQKILPELRKRGITEGRRICSSFTAYSASTFRKAGSALNDTCIWAKFDPSYKGKSWKQLDTAYRKDHNGNGPAQNVIPDIYDAVMATARCYRQLGLDGTETDETSKIEVANWFYNSPEQSGIQGDFRWVKGEKIAPYHYFVFDGNRPVPVGR